MHFCIRACDISALAGRNIFRHKKVAIRRLINTKKHKHNCDELEQNKRIINLIRTGQFYNNAVICKRLTQELCNKAEEECKTILSTHLPKENIQSFFRRFQHLYLKDRGLYIEQLVIQRLQQQGFQIQNLSKKERTFRKTFTCDSGLHTYTIFGCVDCINESPTDTALIEIKSRKQTSMRYIHEIDQIVTYLIISMWPKAQLVEYLNDEIVVSETIDYNSALRTWNNDIKQVLEQSLHEVAQFILDSS